VDVGFVPAYYGWCVRPRGAGGDAAGVHAVGGRRARREVPIPLRGSGEHSGGNGVNRGCCHGSFALKWWGVGARDGLRWSIA
jgi:hypothetical protein